MAPPKETRYFVQYGRMIDVCRSRGIRTQTKLAGLLGLSRRTVIDYIKHGWIDYNFARLANLLEMEKEQAIAVLDARRIDD